jgi:transcription initiation factor IIF auxiliary subunit
MNTNTCPIEEYNAKRETDYWGFDLDMIDELKDPENIEMLIEQSPEHIELYKFLQKNLKSIKDKKHIRLVFG